MALNATCPNTTVSYPLGHVPSGECNFDNKAAVQTFGLAFGIVHVVMFIAFMTLFLYFYCTRRYKAPEGYAQKRWALFWIWCIATLVLVTESFLVYEFNYIPPLVTLVEVFALFIIVIARVLGNEFFHPPEVNPTIKHYANAASATASGIFGVLILVFSIQYSVFDTSNETILVFFFTWLAIVQILDFVRSMYLICYLGDRGNTGRATLALRSMFTFLSFVSIIAGFSLATTNSEYTAIVMLSLSKLFLVLAGYVLVLFPPSNPILRGEQYETQRKKFENYYRRKVDTNGEEDKLMGRV